MATEATKESSNVDEKSENVQSEGRNKKNIHSHGIHVENLNIRYQ